MENLGDNATSQDFASLFIQEKDDGSCEAADKPSTDRSADQSAPSFTGEFVDHTMSIAQYLKEMDDLLKSSEENCGSQEYLSTNSQDTQDDISEVLPQYNCFESYGEEAYVSYPMPLTSAGNKLSESLVEYEGQLLGMLDMMESSVEDENMDSTPQVCTPLDSHEEYVHIPKLFKETANTSLEPSKATALKVHTAAMTVCDQDNTAGEVYVRKRATRALPQGPNHCDLSVSPEKRCDGNNATHVQDECMTQLELTESKQILDGKICTEEDNNSEAAIIADLLHEVKIGLRGLNFGASDYETLGAKLDNCIDKVQGLLQKQGELQIEIMELRGYDQQEEKTEVNGQEQGCQADTQVAELLMRLKKEEHLKREKSMDEISNLRQERAEEERRLWRVSLERQGLQNELRRVKRKLFVIAKECAQSHAAQGAQQKHLELLQKKKDELQTAEAQLKEDSAKMQQEHERQLESLRQELNVVTSSLLSNTQKLSQCRRDSCGDVQQYLQDSLKAQKERYEPILMTLLKRRDTAVDACAKVKEQTQELRVQLTPLREEIQKLTLQKICLEEKVKLISFQRKEKIGQYKEIVDSLEESSRELQMELRVQKTKTNEMKELKEALNKQLEACRSAIENHINCDKETT